MFSKELSGAWNMIKSLFFGGIGIGAVEWTISCRILKDRIRVSGEEI